MSFSLNRNILVLFLVLTLLLVNVSQVSAVCYVRNEDSGNVCSEAIEDICTNNQIANNECASITTVDTCDFGNILECRIGCLCTVDGIMLGITSGIRDTYYSSQDWYETDAECTQYCGTSGPPQTHSISGKVYYVNTNNQNILVTSGTVTLNTGQIVQINNGDYIFSNLAGSISGITYNLDVTNAKINSNDLPCDITKSITVNEENINENTLPISNSGNIYITCTPYKVQGNVIDALNQIVQGATITLVAGYDVIKGSNTIGTNTAGNYEFYMVKDNSVTINVEYNGCTGTQTIIANQNPKTVPQIKLSCEKYNVNVQVINDVQQNNIRLNQDHFVKDVNIITLTGGTLSPYDNINNYYTFTDVSTGTASLTVSKTYTLSPTLSTECSVEDVQINVPSGTNIVTFNDNNCCTTTKTIGACEGGLQTTTITTSGDGCAVQTTTPDTKSCTQNEVIPCEWNYGPWNYPLDQQCPTGVFERTRPLLDPQYLPTGCDSTTLSEPLLNLICEPPQNLNCGNGNLDSGETCDYNENILNGFKISPSCLTPWTKINPLINAAYIVNSNMINDVCNTDYCKCIVPAEPQPPVLTQCQTDPAKISTLIGNVVPNTFQNQLTWTLSNTCTDKSIKNFVLTMCEDTDNNGACNELSVTVNSSILNTSTTFTHNGASTNPLVPKLKANTKYCYTLSAVYGDNTIPGLTSSAVKCIETGDFECMTLPIAVKDSSWCEENNKTSCNINNKKVPVPCGINQQCWNKINNGINTAECIARIPPGMCDRCNAVFGLYSYMSYKIQTDVAIPNSNQKAKIYCPSYSNPNPNINTLNNLGFSGEDYLFGCYLDYSKTTINKVYDCSAVKTCYDYKSEQSCEKDYCTKFTNASDIVECEWNPYVTTGTAQHKYGKGVCAPINVEDQNCELCTNSDYNSITPRCTKEMCGLFGNTATGSNCKFNSDTSSCINKDKLTCTDYTSEESCIGKTSTTPGTNVNVNVKWQLIDRYPNFKIGSLNNNFDANILTPSTDEANIGLCKWIVNSDGNGGLCIKDADNTQTAVAADDCNSITSEENGKWRDLCKSDKSPPVTTIIPNKYYQQTPTVKVPIYGLNMNLQNQLFVVDNKEWPLGDNSMEPLNSFQRKYMKINYCLNFSNNCYPNNTLTVSGDDPYIIDLKKHGFNKLDNDKTVYLRFFSEDAARNLEVVNTDNILQFILDAIEPTIEFKQTIIPYQISPNQWRTDVKYDIKLIAEKSMPVTCELTLRPKPGSETAETIFTFNNNTKNDVPGFNQPLNVLNAPGTITTTYYSLGDGDYEYNYECVDDLGNNITGKADLYIDGDLSISRPWPRGAIFNGSNITNNQVRINISTEKAPNICIFDTTPITSTSYNTLKNIVANTFTPVPNTNSKNHTALVTLLTPRSGLYKYYVACNFTNTDGTTNIVYGNDADNPYFSVDEYAPATKLLFKNPANQNKFTPYVNDKTYEFIAISLNCSDNDDRLKTTSGKYMVFGCEDTEKYYCIAQPTNNIKCDAQNQYTKLTGDLSNILNYVSHNSPAKQTYGNNPTIYYYSKDKGGNGNYNDAISTQLALKNMRISAPTANYLSSDLNQSKTTGTTIKMVNDYSPIITLTYTNETAIQIISFNVTKTDDNTDFTYMFSKPSVNSFPDYVTVQTQAVFLPNGRYRLNITVWDDDNNPNTFVSTFDIKHNGPQVYLTSPLLGIGNQNPYPITLTTPVPSNCEYETIDLSAYNSRDYPTNYKALWYSDPRYTANLISSQDGLTHTFPFDDKNSGTTSFISAPNQLLYAVCKVRNTNVETNDYYAFNSFRYGHQSESPIIEVRYKIDPPISDTTKNIIINDKKPWIWLNVTTNQPSVCRIKYSDTNQYNYPILNIDAPFNGENNTNNFSVYKTNHTYFLNYSGKGVTDGSRYDFNYDITCTNLAQLDSTATAQTVIEFDTTGPTAGYWTRNEYLTSVEYGATCEDNCNSTYRYKLVNIGEECPVATTGYTSKPMTDTVLITDSKRICIKVADVLGREDLKGFDVNVMEFNNGSMSILNPYEYISRTTNPRVNLTRVYSPTISFDLQLRTGTVDVPIGASCYYSLFTSTFRGKNSQQIYEMLTTDGRKFDTTGSDTQTSTWLHTTQMTLNTPMNVQEVWIVACKAYGLGSTDVPYITREIYFYWDNTTPNMILKYPEKIYDWSNREKANISIITDDNTTCNITDNTFPNDIKYVKVGNTIDYIFENYTTNKTYTYNVPLSIYNSDINTPGTDIKLKIECINRAKNYTSQDILIRYEMDKDVSATSNLDISRVYSTGSVNVNVLTDIQSTCTMIVDGATNYALTSTNRLNHTKPLTALTAGAHTVYIECSADNVNIAKFMKTYNVIIDLNPPNLTLVGPNVDGVENTTCSMNGFPVIANMIDGESGIQRYEYSISGTGITTNNYVQLVSFPENMRKETSEYFYLPPLGDGTLVNDKEYTVTVTAFDFANRSNKKTMKVKTYTADSPRITCDQLGPQITITETYHTLDSRAYASVNITCDDSSTDPNVVSSSCAPSFKYIFNENKGDCVGITFNNVANSANGNNGTTDYSNKLLIYSPGTLCIQGTDSVGNPSQVTEKYINVKQEVCGDGIIDKQVPLEQILGVGGFTTDYANFKDNRYKSYVAEQCEGANLDGKGCFELGFVGGDLKCNSTCKFDNSSCTYGQQVKIVNPLPLGIGKTSAYTLTVNSQYTSQCKFIPGPITSTTNIVSIYTSGTDIMTSVANNNHDKSIGPLTSEGELYYVSRYAVCNMTDQTQLPIGSKPEQGYGYAKVYIGYDSTNSIIENITTDKYLDTIADINDREIGINIKTNEDTICKISDSTGTITERIVSGDINKFETYSKTHNNILNYSSIINAPLDGKITLTVKCYNKANGEIIGSKEIYYIIADQIIIYKIIPTELYSKQSNTLFNVRTNINSKCTISNSTTTLDMSGNGLIHDKTIALQKGTNTITVLCVDPSEYAKSARAEYITVLDMNPPNLTLEGPSSYNGPDTTCDLNGFTMTAYMKDAESGISRYEYQITGDGVTSTVHSVQLNSIGTQENTISIRLPVAGEGTLINNEAYTVTVRAYDYVDRVITKTLQVKTYSSGTPRKTCDQLGPKITITDTYLTPTAKNYGIVNVTCDDSQTTSDSTVSSECKSTFTYGFNKNKIDCVGVIYSGSSEYNKKLIFYDNGTLCVKATDLLGNPSEASKFIDVKQEYCGNGIVDKQISLSELLGVSGFTTDYDNWVQTEYTNFKGENCEGANLNGESCFTLGFVSGDLACNPSTCKFDNSSCSNGQAVKIVKPLPLGIGTTSTYILTVNSQYTSQCKYTSGPITSSSNIITVYNNAEAQLMTAVENNNHDITIGPLPNEGELFYTQRYAICHMTNPSQLPIGSKPEQEYGYAKVYRGYDTTSPVIESITTDKYQDTIADINNKKIEINIKTNEDTICNISDSTGTITERVVSGDINKFETYSKTNIASLDYSNLANAPLDGKITLTVKCYNKANEKAIVYKDIYYNIATQVTIEKILPKGEYVTSYNGLFSIRTNINSNCTISNDTKILNMTGTELIHDKTIGLKEGWNTIRVDCKDPSGYAEAAFSEYMIYGGADSPINMKITTKPLTCSLSTITANLSATRTTLDIKHYAYVVTDITTGQILCNSTTSTGLMSCNGNIVEGRIYTIKARAVDLADQTSTEVIAKVNGSLSTAVKCDDTNPIVEITNLGSMYADLVRLNISCTDSGTGCKPYYQYKLLNPDQTCDNVIYSTATQKTYGQFDFTTSKTLCVKATDNNSNVGYASYNIIINNTNYINLVPISAQVSPKYIPSKLIVSSTKITDIDFISDANAQCRYTNSATPLTAQTMDGLYSLYTPFANTGTKVHKITGFDTNNNPETIIDIICYEPDSTNTNKYSRVSYIVSYIGGDFSIIVEADPSKITSWFERTVELSINATQKSVCTIRTNDGQYDNSISGTSSDYTTYSKDHYKLISYNLNTPNPSLYNYDVTCTDYLGRTATDRKTVDYNLPTSLTITVLSPIRYTNRTINILASTNMKSVCKLYTNTQSRGTMIADAEGTNHMITLTIVDGTYKVNITCDANINNLENIVIYNMTVDTRIPPKVCGDGIIQSPNDMNKPEYCDGLNLGGLTCTFGGFTTTYYDGILACKSSDCTFDYSNCDTGQGYCGNGKLDGPNSNNVYEQCDGAILGGATCQSLGYFGGTLSCTNGCMINTSGCYQEGQTPGTPVLTQCNNKILESGEDCELGATILATCGDFGYDYGPLSCANTCQLNMNQCKFSAADNMSISVQELTCSLSSIDAVLKADKTVYDIKHYNYTVKESSTGRIICKGSTTTGNMSCATTVVDGRLYYIEAYAVDTANRQSQVAFETIKGSSYITSKCDLTPPVITIKRIDRGFPDLGKLNITCTDVGGSGCKLYYEYSLLNPDQTCDNATYELTREYGRIDLTMSKNVCVRGYDNNNNYRLANMTVNVENYNYINLKPISETVSPKYVPPKIIATNTELTKIRFQTDVNAICKYSTTEQVGTIEALFIGYTAFTTTGTTSHELNIDLTGKTEQEIDVICYAEEITVPDRKYSRVSYIIKYVSQSLTTTEIIDPNIITEWTNRKTELRTLSNTETICSISSNNPQHNGIKLGNLSDYTTYANNHYKLLEYNINTVFSEYYYDVTCTDYLGRSATDRKTVNYNLSGELLLAIASPITYTTSNISIFAITNMPANCTMWINGVSKGIMTKDSTYTNHVINIFRVSDGTHGIKIYCIGGFTKLNATAEYNITINTTLPQEYCGDGIVQRPNTKNVIEECDGLNVEGKTCTYSGFVGTSYIGGILGCKADCKLDFSNCDTGNGFCGNNKIDGPNSNGVYEQCDGSILKGLTCESFGFKSGKLSCNSGCTINTSGCMQEGQIAGAPYVGVCNNKQLETGEQCEIGGNYSNILCERFGYDYGTVSCASNCMFSMNNCRLREKRDDNNNNSSSRNCGNGFKDLTEDCDSTAINKGMSTNSCKLLDNTYISGNVFCNSECKYDFSDCSSYELCDNGLQDGGETDIDCGGICGDCTSGGRCTVNSDCLSNKCKTGVCVEDTCTNGIYDETTESDVDCGKECKDCSLDKKCAVNADCSSGYCEESICALSPCGNGIRDGNEADVDCGGDCMLCEAGNSCTSGYDCSSGLCEENICTEYVGEYEPERSPAKIPLLIIGGILILCSGGYIIYRTFYDHKPTHISTHSPTPFNPGMNQSQEEPQRQGVTPEQQKAMLARQREAIEHRRQEREKQRKGLMDKLNDKTTDSKPKVDDKPDVKEEKEHKSEEKTDEFVDISELKNKKVKDKEEIFDKLKEIANPKGKNKLSSNKEITDTAALKMFGEIDRETVLSKAFREVLSKLLTDKKISQENVSKILFEYMDKGMITKAEVAKLSKELEII